MAASLLKKVSFSLRTTLCRAQTLRQSLPRYLSNSTRNDKGETDAANSQHGSEQSHVQSTPMEDALRKFDRVVEKVKSQQTSSEMDIEERKDELNESFATMIRKSKLVALGEDEDKRVTGKIIEVMDDDLYIDFGGKFHCVCPRPRKNGELYQRGTEVIISLKSQEMSSAFLGSDIHLTLLEADAVLMGLRSTSRSDKEQVVNDRP